MHGAVQGVGFRPFVYRLATELQLVGWVNNSAQGVTIELEGREDSLDEFERRFENERPPRAIIFSREATHLNAVGYTRFEICESDKTGAKTAIILPDIATCADCVREIFDTQNRRFRYPFTNCTNCGPRWSIIEALPYDRPHTSMKKFTMCPECHREYHDPNDRRFHAQPNACPVCGPQLCFENKLSGEDALRAAADAVRAGKIVALKGLGGFQLLVDARDEHAVARLRARKHREEKPFALMFPDIWMVEQHCHLTKIESRLLTAPESPIVLLRRRATSELASAVAPRNPHLGVMLPYTPLHYLLMRELNFPIVATSGNLSDEPICIDNDEARKRLSGIADVFLTHDRPIVRYVDDSIVRVICEREMVLRRARGFAPLPARLRDRGKPVLALGAHLKNTVALAIDENAFISQHVGDLSTAEAHEAVRCVAADLPRLYDAAPALLACDLHPEYLSTKHAEKLSVESGTQLRRVQHHHAHVLACMTENDLTPPVLGVSWDGTGYGTDQTIWGGEFFVVRSVGELERFVHLKTFPLPGGDAAMREPRRVALGLLFALGGNHFDKFLAEFSRDEQLLLRRMLQRGINTPQTSSAGRLFDAVAALLRIRDRSSFEGQAAMELEFAIQQTNDVFPFCLTSANPREIDWREMIDVLLRERDDGVPAGVLAAKFHNTLVETVLSIAREAQIEQVVLTGGCFQNRYLLERCVDLLRRDGFCPFWHQRIPPNDGGIALGQIVAARSA